MKSKSQTIDRAQKGVARYLTTFAKLVTEPIFSIKNVYDAHKQDIKRKRELELLAALDKDQTDYVVSAIALSKEDRAYVARVLVSE